MDWPPPISRGLLEWAAARYGQAEAVVHGARRFSFGQVLEASCRLAAGLAARGIRRGDRVGMWLPNWPVFVEDYPRTATGKIQRAKLKDAWTSS